MSSCRPAAHSWRRPACDLGSSAGAKLRTALSGCAVGTTAPPDSHDFLWCSASPCHRSPWLSGLRASQSGHEHHQQRLLTWQMACRTNGRVRSVSAPASSVDQKGIWRRPGEWGPPKQLWSMSQVLKGNSDDTFSRQPSRHTSDALKRK